MIGYGFLLFAFVLLGFGLIKACALAKKRSIVFGNFKLIGLCLIFSLRLITPSTIRAQTPSNSIEGMWVLKNSSNIDTLIIHPGGTYQRTSANLIKPTQGSNCRERGKWKIEGRNLIFYDATLTVKNENGLIMEKCVWKYWLDYKVISGTLKLVNGPNIVTYYRH